MYKYIFNHSSDVIILSDIDGNVVDISQRAYDILGLNPESVVNKSIADIGIFSLLDVKRLSDHLTHVLTNQIRSMIELDITTVTGLRKTIEINSGPAQDNGNIKGVISILRDVTERKIQEEISRKNDDKFKMIFDNANDGIVYLDNHAVIRASNKKIEELFGYSCDEIIGRKFIDFPIFKPGDMDSVYEVYRQSFEGKLPPLLEFDGIHTNGNQFYLEINPTLIKENGEMVGLLAIIRDITPRKRTEEERARLIDIIEVTPDLIFTYDSYGDISYINRAGREFFGLSHVDDFSLSSLPNIQKALPTLKRTGLWTGETSIVSKNNESIPVSQVVMSHFNGEGVNDCFSMIMRDISDQKQNEKHIKYLTHHLIKVQEDERLRLARDLHDNLAQDLSSLKIICETLFDSYSDVPTKVQKKISKMSKIFKQTIDSVRDITYNLRPASLSELGIVNTLYRFCDECKDSNIDVAFHTAGMEQVKLDFDAEINIYRIAQEAFSNIKKHSKASKIIVNLTASYPTIIFQIEDNGIGFEPYKRKKELIHEKRMGLKSMEERVGLLNGSFKIQSKVSVGTLIHVEVPYKSAWHLECEIA